jgi:sulfate transport system substrate-binding protein
MQTEFPVAIVDKVVDKKGTRQQATAYLEYLWSEEGQENAARHYLRPRDPELLRKYAASFPAVKTFTVDEVFGSAKQAFATHFRGGGTFDQIYLAK